MKVIRRVVVKIGTTSLTGPDGKPDRRRMRKVTDQVALLNEQGVQCVIVSSAAIAAGMHELGLKGRPTDMPGLQAAAAVGQRRLMDLYGALFAPKGISVGQILLTQDDMIQRRHYLNARQTIDRLLELGCVPIVNENDTVATQEIRYGDNDRLAALVANLVGADLLVMLSDVEGVFTRHPGEAGAELVEQVDEITPALLKYASGSSALGSGGMASKLEAARMATLSGVPAVIASALRKDVLLDAVAGRSVGTYFKPSPSKIQARKLWIAWAQQSRGRIVVDDGAAHALTEGKKSLLAAGVKMVEGNFRAGDAVEVVTVGDELVAKGLVGFDAGILAEIAGTKGNREVIHRDHMVLM
ncbi:MAG TPA: glutamate 5-kinase [Actinomycetota bacterium]|nr:glutamate 5-kinase [Actinomycetota bacterium]